MTDATRRPRECTRIDRFGYPECFPRRIVDLLSDDEARRIYRYADAPTSVGELTEVLEIPRSTAYRKVDRLHEVGLLERLDPRGEAPARYVRAIDHVTVRYDDPLRIECVRNGTAVCCEV